MHRWQVPWDQLTPLHPLPKLRRAKRHCSPETPRQNSQGEGLKPGQPWQGESGAHTESTPVSHKAGAPGPASPLGGEGPALRQAGNESQEIEHERGWGANPDSMTPSPLSASYQKPNPAGMRLANRWFGIPACSLPATTGTNVEARKGPKLQSHFSTGVSHP